MRIDSVVLVVLHRTSIYQTAAGLQLGLGLQRLTFTVKDQDDPSCLAERNRQTSATRFQSILKQTTVNPINRIENDTETELRRRNPYPNRGPKKTDGGSTGATIDLLA